MIRLLAILITTSLLMACNSQRDSKGNMDSISSEEKHESHEKIPGVLTLNKGAKWKADATTKVNVSLLQAIVSGTKKESIENYKQTAAQLQDGLNKMVNECKMKGPDHETLHRWLEPLIEKVKDLDNEKSIEKAAIKLNDIDKHLKLFPQYFE